MDILRNILVSLSCLILLSVAIYTAGIALFWLIDYICDLLRRYQRRRAARFEAQLDRTQRELRDTIYRLAEALAEEKLAAELARRRMQSVVPLASGQGR